MYTLNNVELNSGHLYPIRHQNKQQIGRQHILRTLSNYHYPPTRRRIQAYQLPSNATNDFQQRKFFMEINDDLYKIL